MTAALTVRHRLADVPTRARASLFTFGIVLGAPALLSVVGTVLLGADFALAGALLLALAFLVFFLGTALAWVLIFQARGRLQRAEAAIFAGDLDVATREARFVVSTVFRADYQLAALYALALAAEHLGAFAEAGALFLRAFAMIPTFAAPLPARRVRALTTAHATLCFAACGDLARAHTSLTHAYEALGSTGQPGALESLLKLDDSSLGAIGINTALVELEGRREPRPVAVLASALLSFRVGHFQEAARLLDAEQATVMQGLASHERALAMRVRGESVRLLSGAGGPHRAPAAMQVHAGGAPGPEAWADGILGQRG
jgi:tetratricopeptide (TPR) repeat protein